jgi:hypothetical protein
MLTIADIITDNILDRVYAWLCERRQAWPAAADVWELGCHWPEEKARVQQELRADPRRHGGGTIVLTPFPFTDLSGEKVGPAVLVSRSDRPGRDVLFAFIASQHSSVSSPTDVFIFPKTAWKFAKPCARG